MGTPEDLEGRVSAVEQDVARLRQRQDVYLADADVARRLASAADRDVAEYRSVLTGHTSVLNALRQTQVEHGVRLDGIDGRLDGIDGRLDGLDGRLDGIDGRLDGIDGRLDGLDGRLDGIDGRLDGLDGRLDGIDGRLEDIGGTLVTVTAGMTQIVDLLQVLTDA